ncbi:N-acetylmuramoyl-L-alanine amidase [Chitinispirillum alkaliphilum]|nr:N-acetylmuramoyl-L-alanine amidase [Chitinispirillum alkaliphilum]
MWAERSGTGFDTVIIHYISAVERDEKRKFELAPILEILCDYGVSSHFLIDREGKVYQLVPVENKAWHCGASIMPPPDRRKGVNEFSVGVELIATHHSGFTDMQYRSLAILCKYLQAQCGKELNYLGHSDIAGEKAVEMGLREDKKPDPGPLFNWHKFMQLLDIVRLPNIEFICE